MDWEELALTSHYHTAVAIQEALRAGEVQEAVSSLEELREEREGPSHKAFPPLPAGTFVFYYRHSEARRHNTLPTPWGHAAA